MSWAGLTAGTTGACPWGRAVMSTPLPALAVTFGAPSRTFRCLSIGRIGWGLTRACLLFARAQVAVGVRGCGFNCCASKQHC